VNDLNIIINIMCIPINIYRIGDVLVSVLTCSEVHRGFELCRVKPMNIQLVCVAFSALHAAFKRKNKDCLVRNQDNVSDWSDVSTSGLLFQ